MCSSQAVGSPYNSGSQQDAALFLEAMVDAATCIVDGRTPNRWEPVIESDLDPFASLRPMVSIHFECPYDDCKQQWSKEEERPVIRLKLSNVVAGETLTVEELWRRCCGEETMEYNDRCACCFRKCKRVKKVRWSFHSHSDPTLIAPSLVRKVILHKVPSHHRP